MARRDPTDDAEWKVRNEEDRNVEFLGTTGAEKQSGGAFVYDAADGAIYEAEADDENREVILDESSVRQLDAEETLGEAIEDIGETVGWDGLSEFAREHLEDEDDEN